MSNTPKTVQELTAKQDKEIDSLFKLVTDPNVRRLIIQLSITSEMIGVNKGIEKLDNLYK